LFDTIFLIFVVVFEDGAKQRGGWKEVAEAETTTTDSAVEHTAAGGSAV